MLIRSQKLLLAGFLLVHAMLISAEFNPPVVKKDDVPFEHIRASDIVTVFPNISDLDRNYLESLIVFSGRLKEDSSIRILLPKNKCMYYMSPHSCNPKCQSVFAVKSSSKFQDAKTLDLRALSDDSNMIKVISVLNEEAIVLSGEEADRELLKIVDYYLLWNDNFTIPPNMGDKFKDCHQWCLEGNVPGYKNSKLRSAYEEILIKDICSHSSANEDFLSLIDMLLSGVITNREDRNLLFLEKGLKAIAQKHITKNPDLLKEGLVNLPNYLSRAVGFPPPWVKRSFIDSLQGQPKKITKENYNKNEVFGECDSDIIYLEVLFEAVFQTGKVVEARLKDGKTEFHIVKL